MSKYDFILLVDFLACLQQCKNASGYRALGVFWGPSTLQSQVKREDGLNYSHFYLVLPNVFVILLMLRCSLD